MKKFRLVTLGCKVNQYETQALREQFLQRGLQEDDHGGDVIVLNTCTVTAGADKENRYWVRRLRRENPQAKIVVTGCWAEKNRAEAEALAGVDEVFGHQEKPQLVRRLFEGCGTPEIQGEASENFQISSFPGQGRAFLKIQDGCNHACSFCKVVLVRGRSRSRLLPEIVEEAERLGKSGFREIVLAGIQLGAYGKDLELSVNLSKVMDALSQIPLIERIRLSSIEPVDVIPELIQTMKNNRKACPQLHIPLQSGDAEVLKAMNRRYGREFYQNLIRTLRGEIPDFCLSMDVMAGFPAESEQNFENTLELLRETRPIRVHAFPYSRREGTRAARLPDLPGPVLKNRMNRLRNFSREITRLEKEKFVGRIFPVLMESFDPETGWITGHTANYLKVKLPGFREYVSQFASVRLTGFEGEDLTGTLEETSRG